MIKFKKDLFIISIVSALLVGVWFVLSIYNDTERVELTDKNLSRLIRFPKYKLKKEFFVFLVQKTTPVDKTAIYNPQVQPFNQTEIRRQLKEIQHASTAASLKESSGSGNIKEHQGNKKD